MELINKHKHDKNSSQYFCEITDKLDILSGLKQNGNNYLWRHYIVADNFCIKNRCLAIRVPGGTVGGIWLDENDTITNIKVDKNYVVKTYPEDINELLKEFIYCKINNLNKCVKE